MEQLSTLRATAQRLSVTPLDDLPRIAGFLASSVSSCSRLRTDAETKQGIDFSGPLHKLRTRLSSLLQDRGPSGRLTAAVVIKAYVETVRPVETAQWEAWARGLIACLNKPDPWECKQFYVTTATRIFLLCRGSPTLQREVVSPLLPAFLNAVLASLKPVATKKSGSASHGHSQLLQVALLCWQGLLQEFSQTFRPFATRIRQICLGVLSDSTTPRSLRDQATQVLCALHLCAPKTIALSDWDQSISNIIVAAHETLDLLLRGVIEDWSSSSTSISQRTIKQNYSKPPELSQADPAGLSPWKGIHQGANRVQVLLHWLSCCLKSRSQASELPLGAVVDLLARVTAVAVPSAGNETRTSSEVGRDEREELWANLPQLHLEALELSRSIAETLDLAMVPLLPTFAGQAIDMFHAEGWNAAVRASCYRSIADFLQICGQALSRIPPADFGAVVKACCQDLMCSAEVSSNEMAAVASIERKDTTAGQKTALPPRPTGSAGLLRSAEKLMVLVYEQYPACLLPHSIRTELDRAAILYNSKTAMMASVVNPSRQASKTRVQPSLIPFLAQVTGGNDYGMEMLLRPRIPAICGISFSAATGRNKESQDATMNGHESPSNSIDAVSLDHDRKCPETASTGQVTDDPFSALTVEDGPVASKKRDYLSTLTGGASAPVDAVSIPSGLHKKPRLDDGDWSAVGVDLETALPKEERQASSETLHKPKNAQPQSFSAGDEITVHGAPDTAVMPNVDTGDSDDESDIPEIDPELASDDDENA